MPTNVYFNNYYASGEQQLIEDLCIESIRQYGVDVWYINRQIRAEDRIFREDDLPLFDAAYQVEMYIKSIDGFEGDGDFLSKFGLEIRDEITFSVARRVFAQEVTLNEAKNVPYAGDLIYFPLNRKVFEIKHCEHESIFYQMGSLQIYDLRCELFEYSGEDFDTGINEIDSLFTPIDFSANTTSISELADIDPLARNEDYEQEADDIINFDIADPFSTGGRW